MDLRDILMSRGKNCLPTASRQLLTRNCPRPNCLLKSLPNCLSPTREGFFSFFQKKLSRGEGNCETNERQELSRGNFCPRDIKMSLLAHWETAEKMDLQDQNPFSWGTANRGPNVLGGVGERTKERHLQNQFLEASESGIRLVCARFL